LAIAPQLFIRGAWNSYLYFRLFGGTEHGTQEHAQDRPAIETHSFAAT
jgi:hypothetical protein